MDKRKLVKAGASSLTISLPRKWVQKNKLSRGDEVFVLEQDNSLHIQTYTGEKAIPQKEISISIDEKTLASLGREITSAYMNNFTTITLHGDVRGLEEPIRKIINSFVALEITEQTSKRIVARNLLNPKEIDINKTLRRTDMIVRSMFQDAAEDPKKHATSISQRDYDVNRMYFLLCRLLKAAVSEPALNEHIGIDAKDVLGYWDAITNVENMADCVKNVVPYLATGKSKMAVQLFKDLSTLYDEAMKGFYTNDKSIADAVAQKRPELLELITPLSPEFSENYKSMLTIINVIARTTLDRE
jgi:phosphate uptake regulator